MFSQTMQRLIEKLNVDNANDMITNLPDLKLNGEYDVLSVTVSSRSIACIQSIAKGIEQLLSTRPDIKSENVLTTPKEFFTPTKPPEKFHYIILNNTDLHKLCKIIEINFEEIKEEYKPRINNDCTVEKISPRLR